MINDWLYLKSEKYLQSHFNDWPIILAKSFNRKHTDRWNPYV